MKIYRKTDYEVKYTDIPDTVEFTVKNLRNKGFEYEKLLFRSENVFSKDSRIKYQELMKRFPEFIPFLYTDGGRFSSFILLSNCTEEWKPRTDLLSVGENIDLKKITDILSFLLSKKIFVPFTVSFFNVAKEVIPFDEKDTDTITNFDGSGNYLEFVTSSFPVVPAPSVSLTFSSSEKTVFLSITEFPVNSDDGVTFSIADAFDKYFGQVKIDVSDYVIFSEKDRISYKAVEKEMRDNIEKASNAISHWAGKNDLFEKYFGTAIFKGNYTDTDKRIIACSKAHDFSILSLSKDKLTFIKTDDNNHALKVTFIKTKNKGRIDTDCVFYGMGFSYKLTPPFVSPTDNEHLNAFADAVFSSVSYAYDTYLYKVSKAYPKTPKWYTYKQ